MRINFEQRLKKLDGTTIDQSFKCPACGVETKTDGPVGTLKQYACDALNAIFDDERQLSGEEKAKRGVLAMRIYSNPTGIDLEVEEIALVKKVIGKGFGPLIVHQAWEILELKNDPKTESKKK